MKLLPSRNVFCALQIATRIRAVGDLIPSCQSAVFWLLVWPELLGWKRRVYWLRVSDATRRSGQCLWGIDSAGNLLLVEIRNNCGKTMRDPFKNLTCHVKADGGRAWSTRELRAIWHDSRQMTGDVASTSENEVEVAFLKRQAAGNPPPILMVLVSSARCEFRLSDEGLKNLLLLETLAGSARVALRALSGRLGIRGIRIRCWSPRPAAANNRRWRRRLR